MALARSAEEQSGIEEMTVVYEKAYKESVQLSTQELSAHALHTFGQRVTAVGTGQKDARPVRKWAEGGDIRAENEDRLRLLYRIGRSVQLMYDEETARAFLRSSNPHLGDRSPLEAIVELESAPVLSALRAFLKE